MLAMRPKPDGDARRIAGCWPIAHEHLPTQEWAWLYFAWLNGDELDVTRGAGGVNGELEIQPDRSVLFQGSVGTTLPW